MNIEQTKTTIRWIVTTFGAGATAFIVGKGWANSNDVTAVITSNTFIEGVSAVIALVPLIWSLFRHTEKNQIAATDNIPHVAGVIMKDTPEGKELAKEVPSPTVVPAGTVQAKKVAA